MLLPNVIVFAAYIFDILSVLKPLSLQFQADDATPASNHSAIVRTFGKLNKLKSNGFPTPAQLRTQISQIPVEGPPMFSFQNNNLTFRATRGQHNAQNTVGALFERQQQFATGIVDTVIKCMQARFDLATKNPAVVCTKILDTARLIAQPQYEKKDGENIMPPFITDDYGDAEVMEFAKHFTLTFVILPLIWSEKAPKQA